ncbi:MAG: hypothetical protein ACI8UO_002649 [Verrucomicrobiales bacterium]|jgi:membrane protein implicated in regulation of membrane protease activity
MNGIEAWHIWIIIGILLITIEIFVADFFLALIGVAALVTSFVAAAEAGMEWQLACFTLISFILLLTVRPLVKRLFYAGSDKHTSNVDALSGRTAIVVEPIPNSHEPGRVRLGSEEWRAISHDDSRIEEGSKVEVVRVDSATLIVKALES